jgi:translocator protein
MNEAAPVRRSQVRSFWFSVALTMAVSAIGGLATAHSLDSWYAGLNKPSFNPPNWMFAPVWTTLYILMAIAAWRIYLGPESRSRRAALALYALQLALNLAWSLIFFGLRSPFLALLELALLLMAIVGTAVSFGRLDRPAGLLLVPYALWSAFAFVLNLEILRLNRLV